MELPAHALRTASVLLTWRVAAKGVLAPHIGLSRSAGVWFAGFPVPSSRLLVWLRPTQSGRLDPPCAGVELERMVVDQALRDRS